MDGLPVPAQVAGRALFGLAEEVASEHDRVVGNFLGTVIRDVATTGNSGSGVFDANKKCLLGIMSRKISQQWTRKDNGKKETVDIAKYFVPASVIASFIPAQWR